ncbi:sensor histidine kinase [Streptomyces oceani]|uniref:histidine kinase n=1 Tax=Streptomyces oceani TaxID=1075402 RepID=A0A1E7KPF8_9ACTN|nr:sensor histidine kinase [Streptomyces oceani]OEV05711.1 chitinase [Streptomyces oceani]
MRRLLPRPTRPHRDDVLIALGGLLGGLLVWEVGLGGDLPLFGVPNWAALIALAVMSGAELLRRTAPQAGLLLATGALVLDVCAGTLVSTMVMFTDLVYAAVVYGRPTLARRLPWISVLLTVISTVVPPIATRSSESLLIGLSIGLIFMAPCFTGAIVRNHREVAAAERLRAEQTALLAEMDRTQAVNAERSRMARELHDLVANHLSAIAIHATAALSFSENSTRSGDAQHAADAATADISGTPDTSAASATHDALGVIRENSVQGLAEMRRLIGILRDAEDTDGPIAAPTLADLDTLFERARGTAAPGFAFTLSDTRQPDADPLPAPVELAAYRVIQESLTNAQKHAVPGVVTVRVAYAEESRRSLSVRVTSTLGDAQGPRAPGSGAGLIGMRERVELLHGTLETGPVSTDAGGKVWEVRAVLPMSRA